jgi:hypothetical protein
VQESFPRLISVQVIIKSRPVQKMLLRLPSPLGTGYHQM